MSDFSTIVEQQLKVFFEKIESKVNKIEDKVNKLELIINSMQNSKSESVVIQDDNIIELKKEHLNIPFDIVKKSLVYKDFRTVLYLFKYYYKNKTNQVNVYPIKLKSKRVYEYYNNNQWIIDNNAHFIKYTLFMNIQTELYKYNNIDNVSDIDDIYNNQIFITKLSDDKHKREIFKHIVDEIQSY
jgi:hypothetical protein